MRPLLSVSNTPVEGQSGGAAFNSKGELVGICSGYGNELAKIALGFGLSGKAAEEARAANKTEARQWGLYVLLEPLDALLKRGNDEADALAKLESALKEYREVRRGK